MTWSPSFSPESTSKYLSPAMPTFTGRKSASLVAHHEDALDFLPRLARRQLGRRWAVGSTPRGRRFAFSSLLLADDLALLVEDQLANGHRLNRHRTATRVRVAVVISAEQVNPGRTSGNLPVDRHGHLEVRRLLSGRVAAVVWIGLLPISVTLPVKVCPAARRS